MKFKGHTVQDQPAANWKQIYRECAKHPEFIVEVRKYDPEKEISLQQMKSQPKACKEILNNE